MSGAPVCSCPQSSGRRGATDTGPPGTLTRAEAPQRGVGPLATPSCQLPFDILSLSNFSFKGKTCSLKMITVNSACSNSFICL